MGRYRGNGDLACATSSSGLFLSSASSASLQRQVAAQCPAAAQPAITSAIGRQVIASQRYAPPDPTLDLRVRAAMARQNLPPPDLTMLSGAQLQMDSPRSAVAVRLFDDHAALGNVEQLQGLSQLSVTGGFSVQTRATTPPASVIAVTGAPCLHTGRVQADERSGAAAGIQDTAPLESQAL